MKKTFSLLLLAAALTTSGLAQTTPIDGVTGCINTFVDAADVRDVKTLETVLASGFRIMMNRMFGSAQVDMMDRTLYLSKISSGEFGGEKRQCTIEQVNVNGNTATAVVKLAGSKMTFTSTLVLVQDPAGRWQIVSDVPVIG